MSRSIEMLRVSNYRDAQVMNNKLTYIENWLIYESFYRRNEDSMRMQCCFVLINYRHILCDII